MTRPPNRLDAAAANGFDGSEIRRDRPLRFLLNGLRIAGFEGDTVLSAALASGVDTLGMLNGSPISLDEQSAPLVLPASGKGAALPMAWLPARDGSELVTLDASRETHGASAWLRRLSGQGTSLGLDLARGMQGVALSPIAEQNFDFAIVGGGIAGLSAAYAAAASGAPVVLIERRSWLGGDAAFFGAINDEENPSETIERLRAGLVTQPHVTIMLRAEALELRKTSILVHHIDTSNDEASARPIRIHARHVILATGMIERLPIFPGNRLPGIVGSVAAFHRATRYGLWQSGPALLATQNNHAYRLALRAHDAGVSIKRLTDSRIRPQSRFIDFAKANGLTIAAGMAPLSAEISPAKTGELAVRFSVGFAEIDRASEPQAAGQLIVAGGWQPDLALWARAGGACRWNPLRQRIEAQGHLENIVLAGAAAGYLNASACARSGEVTLAILRGQPIALIDDTQVDTAFETPEGSTSIAPANASPLPAYLEGGRNFPARSAVVRKRRFGGRAHPQVEMESQASGLPAIAARVQLGEISAGDAEILVRERVGVARKIVALAPPSRQPVQSLALTVPPYLAGRYGPRPIFAVVAVNTSHVFEIGTLIFPTSAVDSPQGSIGVIIAPAPKGGAGGLALLATLPSGPNERVVIKEADGPVPVTRIERYRPEA